MPHHCLQRWDDDDARWVRHQGMRTVHGFKGHVGVHADTASVEEISITSGDINDGTFSNGVISLQ